MTFSNDQIDLFVATIPLQPMYSNQAFCVETIVWNFFRTPEHYEKLRITLSKKYIGKSFYL